MRKEDDYKRIRVLTGFNTVQPDDGVVGKGCQGTLGSYGARALQGTQGLSRVLKRIRRCAADDGFADGRAHLLADRYERLADCRPDGLSNAAADDRA